MIFINLLVKRETDEYKSNTDNSKENIYKDLIKILEGDYQPDKTLSKKEQEYDEIVFNKLKGFYNSCKYNYNNNNGSKPLFNLFNKLKISEKKDKYHDPNELAKTLAELDQIKSTFLYTPLYYHLFNMNIDFNNININNNEFSISLSEASSLTLYYTKDELVDFLSKIYDGSDRDVNKMVDLIMEFENKLFNFDDDEEDEETTDNLLFDYENIDYENIDLEQMFLSSSEIISLKTLNEMYPNINWKLYLEEVFKSVDINDVITDETEISLMNKKYIENLNRILAETDGETLSYYFEFYIITNYKAYLPDNLQQYDIEPYTEEEITKNCYEITKSVMKTALSRYYVINNNFSQDKKQYAEKIIEYIKQSMINRIQTMEWLDDETIEYAYKKVTAMTEIVGYQDSLLDIEQVYEEYKSMEIDENDYFTNMVNYFKYLNGKKLKIVVINNKDKIKDDIYMGPYDVNAQYQPGFNEMIIPVGTLQPPLFSSGIPDYINYGGIGMLIGHEFTHAFDHTGKDFDMEGNIFEWWTDNDLEEYNDLSQCFIDEYNEFYLEDSEGKKYNVNGANTLNENLADNGGIARAYESWKLSLMEDPEIVKKENPQLPGLTQYTADQLFFISYGHTWCDNIPKNPSDINLIIFDEHAPHFTRVNGVVRNYDEFAKAFNCPLNSKMNPEKKCKFW